MNKFLSMLPKIFTNDSNALLHFCLALSHCLTMAFTLYFSWLIKIDGGGFIAWPISALVTYLFCYWKEKTDKTGFSKQDLYMGVWGIVVSAIIFTVVLNIHNYV